MNLDELRNGYRKSRREIESALHAEGARLGADAAALVEDRIVTKGRRADGQSFSPYSTKPGLAWWYLGRSKNNAGEAAVKAAAKKKQGVSYSDFRRFNGLNTSVKSFQFTGEMWQGFGVKDVKVVARGLVEVILGGKNDRSEKLLGYHEAREGASLTEPSDKEKEIILTSLTARLRAIIERNV